MKVLVTGGAGFIGSHLIERYLGKGHQVTVLDSFDDFYDPAVKRLNLEEASRHPAFRLVEGDIRDAALVDSIFLSTRPDLVVHLAARAGVRPSIEQPVLYQDVNVAGTQVMLEAARKSGCTRFVFASSSSVYGNNAKVPFSEDDNVMHPVSPYAATKLAGELLGYTYWHLHGIEFCGLRFFTVYGPRQRPEMAIHKFARLIDEGREVPQFGDGSSRRDYTWIDDIIDGIEASAERFKGFEIFNLGESTTTSLAELIALISGALGKPAKIKPMPFQPGDVDTTYADISRARRKIGYAPSCPVEEGIPRFIDWYVRHRAARS